MRWNIFLNIDGSKSVCSWKLTELKLDVQLILTRKCRNRTAKVLRLPFSRHGFSILTGGKGKTEGIASNLEEHWKCCYCH